MKKMTIIIRQGKQELLKQLLHDSGVKGMTISNVVGCGNQKGCTEFYRGTQLRTTLIHKVKVDVVVSDDVVEEIIDKICKAISTNTVGDGKIFISPIENAVRIRTGEKGEKAL
ncbi:nitrogen regulatory protein P-II [Clostridium ragsdalei P11]|uniref:Nitrogen regulatory protein P-II n=1 Tax=Clostridium ragsdalei P11 TaxID=1353534 RepID=A0A1A6APC7_9CLOT|nr:P-II family nitrogen regulator [Clostridium ragsdalei]OBR91924.1 nitrogen regulatory protein P-II [Clostridium ragsdalei P11]